MFLKGMLLKLVIVLLILEAVKMENEIKCAVDGTVKSIHVEEGQALESGVLMMEIEGMNNNYQNDWDQEPKMI